LNCDAMKGHSYGMPVSANFPTTPHPQPRHDKTYIRTAAALIIGDEVLNGKIMDTNSNEFAKYCFSLGIKLLRVEIIADDEKAIIEASKRMVQDYDFVITSGGIGPTHDDITYASLAKAFGKQLKEDPEALRRMDGLARPSHKAQMSSKSNEQLAARRRMATFPDPAEVIWVASHLWVPVVRLEGKLCVLPGIPQIFKQLLDGLTPYLSLPPDREYRQFIYTRQREYDISPYLNAMQNSVEREGIKIGSYPMLRRGETCISLIGRDRKRLLNLAKEIAPQVQGRVGTWDPEPDK